MSTISKSLRDHLKGAGANVVHLLSACGIPALCLALKPPKNVTTLSCGFSTPLEGAEVSLAGRVKCNALCRGGTELPGGTRGRGTWKGVTK